MLKVTGGLIVCAVRDLMRESKSGQEWRQNAETVKTYFGGDQPPAFKSNAERSKDEGSSGL